jgi:hypothetical protein
MTNHDNESTDIQEIQTIPLRWDNGSTVLRMTEALEAAGLDAGGSLRFDPSAVDDLGMLPAIGSSSHIDGRRDPLASSIQAKGSGNTLSVAIPSDGLRALGIDPDGIDWEQPPRLTVWAGEQLIALERPPQRQISVDQPSDRNRDADGTAEVSDDE